MKIYFAGAIRGGREDVARYLEIVERLRQYGAVLTEHIAEGKMPDIPPLAAKMRVRRGREAKDQPAGRLLGQKRSSKSNGIRPWLSRPRSCERLPS